MLKQTTLYPLISSTLNLKTVLINLPIMAKVAVVLHDKEIASGNPEDLFRLENISVKKAVYAIDDTNQTEEDIVFNDFSNSVEKALFSYGYNNDKFNEHINKMFPDLRLLPIENIVIYCN